MQRAIISVLICSILVFKIQCELYIDNFQTDGDTSLWIENSDTVMKGGKSKASFVITKSSEFRRAVLFTLLDPYPKCGAALAGFKKNVKLDIRKYKTLSMRIRGKGQFRRYEFAFLHKGYIGGQKPSYTHYFTAPKEFEVISLPIRKFKPHLKGQLVKDAERLDKRNITSVIILADGGINKKKKQLGVAALEIDWIKLD